MAPQVYTFKWLQDERYIADQPWVKALKLDKDKRKAGLPTSIDHLLTSRCGNRYSYQLQSIGAEGRSPTEKESWSKVLDHAEKQARIRAIQLHLSCVSTLAALPYALACCGCKPLPAAPAAVDGLTTDEIEREWIYDTGAAMPFIGWDYLTDEEKRRTYQAETINVATAGGVRSNSLAVICNIPYLGKRQVRVMDDSPLALSVRREVIDHHMVFSYTRQDGPVLSLSDGTGIYLG